MSEKNINPEKITKPIQLLAAWLVGLFSLSSSFLVAATNFDSASWQSGLLVVAAIINVPLFLGAVFLLQTRFRPELQEDSYYSTYLSKKTNEEVKVPKNEHLIKEMTLAIERIEETIKPNSSKNDSTSLASNLLIGINRHLNDHAEIKSILGKHRVKRVSSFGTEETPETRVMSISMYLSESEIDFAINLALEIGMDGYNLFNNREEETEEDILIGSYGNTRYELVGDGA